MKSLRIPFESALPVSFVVGSGVAVGVTLSASSVGDAVTGASVAVGSGVVTSSFGELISTDIILLPSYSRVI